MSAGLATALDRLDLIEKLVARECPFAAVLLADDFAWLREWATVNDITTEDAHDEALDATLQLEALREMTPQG